MLVIKAGIHKMFVRIANSEDPEYTASDLCLLCLPRPLQQATSIHNFRTFIVTYKHHLYTAMLCYIFSEIFDLKMKYDESDNPVVRASRLLTDKMSSLFGK